MPQLPLVISKELSDAATTLTSVLETTSCFAVGLMMHRHMIYWIVKVWSSGALCQGVWENSRSTETICTGLWETVRVVEQTSTQLCRSFDTCSGIGSPVVLSTSHLVYHIHLCCNHNKICYIIICNEFSNQVYIHTSLWSIWLSMGLLHN
jgi:hypothetical protein